MLFLIVLTKIADGIFMQEPDEQAVIEQSVNEQVVNEKRVIDKEQLKNIIESALMAYSQPLTIEKLQTLFTNDHLLDSETETAVPNKNEIVAALEAISESCNDRGFELKKVSSGWRFQVRAEMAPWINKLWEEKPQKYSRALLETLSIIAYRQPITRGDIEEIRGVAVSSHIIKTLSEREWVKVVGHRDVPGRPSLFATTRQFLDYFNLESLEDLPSLRELADIDSLTPELDLEPSHNEAKMTGGEAQDKTADDLNDDVQEAATTDVSDDADSDANDNDTDVKNNDIDDLTVISAEETRDQS